MANPVEIKGATATVNGSASLGGAQLLYAQPTFGSAPSPYEWNMSKWIYLRGGTYRIRLVADDKAVVSINGGDPITVVTGVVTTISAALPAGASKFEINVTNSTANSPCFIGFAMFNGSDANPEYVTSPTGWVGDLEEMPSPGDRPEVTVNINLPVFPIEHNWSDPITETFEFLTDVMVSESSAEQRRKIRMFPRRIMTAKFAEWDLDGRTLDIALAGLGQSTILVPLWFDKQGLHEAIKEGDYDIPGDFTERLDFSAGRLMLLKNPNNYLDSEVIIIKEVYDDKVVSSRAIKKDWPVGTIIYPLSRGRINQLDSISRQTSKTIEASVQFELLDPLKISGKWNYTDANASTGLHVLTGLQNNWRDATTIEMSRNVVIQDNAVSPPVVVDVGGNALTTQRLSLMTTGRAEYKALVQLIYAMSGQFSLFQFPTRMNDIELARDIAHHEGYLVCLPTGYTEFSGDKQDVRKWVIISLKSGRNIYAKVISVKRDDKLEYLVLEQAVGDIMRKDILMVCWCPISRLGSDSVEIQHQTDTNGVCETVLAINSFYNRRKVK